MSTRVATAALAAALLVLLAAAPVLAQDSGDDLKKEIEALKQGQQKIEKQIQELKTLIQNQAKAQAQPQRPSGPNVKGMTFDVAKAMAKGQAGAKLTILEFTDYQ